MHPDELLRNGIAVGVITVITMDSSTDPKKLKELAPKPKQASKPASADGQIDAPRPSSSKSEKSTLSVSVSTKQQVEELVAKFSRNGTLKGEPIKILDRGDFDKIVSQVTDLIESKVHHTVSPVELSTLNAELAHLRLQLNLFEDKTKRAEFAEKTLAVDVQRFKSQIALEAKERAAQVAASQDREQGYKEMLAKLRKESTSLKQQIGQAKTAKNGELLSELSVLKQNNGQKITEINNLLQEINKLKAENKAAISKYQHQLLALTTELNFERAKVAASGPEGPTFASLAAASGKAAVNLYSRVSSVLSRKSQEALKVATSSDPEDIKNKAHWIVRTLDGTKHAMLVPYKLLFEGIYDDLRALDYKSRQAFQPLVDRMIRVLQGKEDLSVEEVEQMLDSLDTNKFKMSHKIRAKGIETWADYVRLGRDIDGLMADDLDSEIAEQARQAFLDKEKLKFKKAKGKEPIRPSSSDSHGQKKKPKSAYTWFRSKVAWTVHKLLRTSKAKSQERASVRATSWLRNKLGFVGILVSLPIAFCSFLTGSCW